MHAIEACRTAQLGGHAEHCPTCGFERYAYNSCRNRHCPQCQTFPKVQWVEDRKAALLPVPYFHLVFTVPHDLNPLILAHKRPLLTLLFNAASQTLVQFGHRNLGGPIGCTMASSPTGTRHRLCPAVENCWGSPPSYLHAVQRMWCSGCKRARGSTSPNVRTVAPGHSYGSRCRPSRHPLRAKACPWSPRALTHHNPACDDAVRLREGVPHGPHGPRGRLGAAAASRPRYTAWRPHVPRS